MNLVDRPLPRPSHDPDDVDQLLRTFFHEEVPNPWPAVEPPPRPARQGWTRWSLLRSRFTLAASVALLLTAGLLVAGMGPGNPLPGASSHGPLPRVGKRDHPRTGTRPPILEDASKAASGKRAPTTTHR